MTHFPVLVVPNVSNLRSPIEWSGSSKVIANGSPKTDAASRNDTPCFLDYSRPFCYPIRIPCVTVLFFFA
jgi:hypothetical protein